MEGIRTRLAEEVYLTYLPARKFKTSVLSAQFLVPLREETASGFALLPPVLRRGTVTCPNMGLLSAKLDRLYGARIESVVRKIGETHCLGFVASMIDDSFTPGGERLLEDVAGLLGELVCDPATERGRFVTNYFESERTNLTDAIRSLINDKRAYADRRLLQEMCAGEPYGVSRLGEQAGVEKLQAGKLYTAYQKLLSTARLELFYSGSASQGRVEQAMRAAFSSLPREKVEPLLPVTRHAAPDAPRTITESLDVTQGKLGMGFTCKSRDWPALLLGNTLFGGSSNSKLFLNVREKLSLCYYASSTFHRSKGLITVSSGIEFENYQKAYDEIMAQLQAVQNGNLEDWELEAARSTLLNAYASMQDSQGRMENFCIGSIATGQNDSLEDLARQVRETPLERIQEAMGSVALDTVYFLRGKEDAE
ncbi:MAG: insulinase family protein [Oscillibacter sp.]|nr:insulinase family protein [Oscillibacter sp.]